MVKELEHQQTWLRTVAHIQVKSHTYARSVRRDTEPTVSSVPTSEHIRVRKDYINIFYCIFICVCISGEKNHKCAVCGKAFADTSQLKSHMNIHSGVKPYCCSMCGQRYTQSGSLYTHMRTQHVNK